MTTRCFTRTPPACLGLRLIFNPIADLYSDIATEEKARATYQWFIDMTGGVELQDDLKLLREREGFHSLRFRELVEILNRDAQKCLKKSTLTVGGYSLLWGAIFDSPKRRRTGWGKFPQPASCISGSILRVQSTQPSKL